MEYTGTKVTRGGQQCVHIWVCTKMHYAFKKIMLWFLQQSELQLLIQSNLAFLPYCHVSFYSHFHFGFQQHTNCLQLNIIKQMLTEREWSFTPKYSLLSKWTLSVFISVRCIPSCRDLAAAKLNLCLPNIKNICIDFLTMGTGNKH